MGNRTATRHSVRPADFDDFATITRDKDPPPYFAGRENVVADIENACAASWARHVSGSAQHSATTRVVYGAPGAGKSSLLRHLEERWANGDFVTLEAGGSVRAQPVPRMFYLQGGWLSTCPEFILRNTAELVDPSSKSHFLRLVTETGYREGSVSGGMIKGNAGRSRTEQHFPLTLGLETLARLLPREKWRFPVVIGIDEAQNATGDRDSPMGKLLQEFHDNNYDLPLTVVLSGLSDTEVRANDLGLTRLSRNFVHALDCLTSDEMDELKHGFCEHYGISLNTREAEFDALLAGTEGWPSHIANCLTSFAKIYRQCGCDTSRVDFKEVERDSLDARRQYYRSRLSPVLRISGQLLAMLVREIDDGCSPSQAISIIRKLSEKGERTRIVEQELPDEMNARDYYAELIHQGILQEYSDGVARCPIPSFRRYIIKQYPVELPQTHSRDTLSGCGSGWAGHIGNKIDSDKAPLH